MDWEQGAFQCYAAPTSVNYSIVVDGNILNILKEHFGWLVVFESTL